MVGVASSFMFVSACGDLEAGEVPLSVEWGVEGSLFLITVMGCGVAGVWGSVEVAG